MRIISGVIVYDRNEIYTMHKEESGRYFIRCSERHFEIIDSAKIKNIHFEIIAIVFSFEVALTICKLLIKNYEESKIKVSNLYDYSEKRIDINKKYGG